MKFLNRPDLRVSPVRIFEECVNGYQQPEEESEQEQQEQQEQQVQHPLMKCRDAVEIDTGKYREELLNGKFKATELPEGIDKKTLSLLYEQKFVKKPGRTYYDQIMAGVGGDRCPVCGRHCEEFHLDHYLPKGKFPTLCVMPDNLVPMCYKCNKQKGTKYSVNPKKRPLHLYFDRLPMVKDSSNGEMYMQTFLYAELESDVSARFYAKYPADWDKGMCGRVDKHLEVFDLLERYQNSVISVIVKVWCAWRDKLAGYKRSDDWKEMIADGAMTEKALLNDLIEDLAWNARRDPNSLESALYRGMLVQIDETYVWFKQNEEAIKKENDKIFGLAVSPA